jgi:hypothetical protein
MRFLITSLVLTFALTGLIGCAAEDGAEEGDGTEESTE